MLNEKRRKQLDGIVEKMVSNQESDSNIQFVVNDFKQKYGKTDSKIVGGLKKAFEVPTSIVRGGIKGAIRIASGLGEASDPIRQPIAAAVETGLERITPGTPNQSFADNLSEMKQRREQVLSDTEEVVAANGFAEKAGSFGADVASFALPATKISKAGGMVKSQILGSSPTLTRKIMANLGRGATEGAGFAATEFAASGGDVGDATAVGIGAGALSILGGPAVAAINKIAAPVLKNTAGFLTNKGRGHIDLMLKDPKAAMEGLSGKSLDVLNKSVKEAQTAAKTVKRKMDEDFAQTIKKIQSDFMAKKQGGNVPELNLNSISDDLQTLFSKYNVQTGIGNDGGILIKNRVFSEAENKKLNEALSVVNKWDDYTPKGLHDLSRTIERNFKEALSKTDFNPIIGGIASSIKDVVKKAVPEYDALLQRYSASKDILNIFEKQLAVKLNRPIGGQEGIDTGRKVTTLLSGDKTQAQDFVSKNIVGGDSLMAREAGRQIASGPSRASQSIGDLARGIMNTVVDPTFVGKLVARYGITAQQAEKAVTKLNGLPVAQRAVFLETLDSIFGEQ